MAELIKIAEKLQKAILELHCERAKLNDLYLAKSVAEAEYERKKASISIGLRNGSPYELDGEEIVNPPTTIIPDIVKGLCWKEKLEASKAEGMVKATESNLKCLQSALNGYQSIYRHLE